jgi:hypothetical protein
LQLRQLRKHRSWERLFEHHQSEVVERAERIEVRHVVSAVGIDKERDVAELIANGLNEMDVTASLDLDLYALIAIL